MSRIKLSMICSYLLYRAYSRRASSTSPLHSSSMIELSFRQRVSSSGSLKLNPKVIQGRLAYMAVSYTACRAMGANSFSITLFMTALQRYSSISLSQPASPRSQWPKVTVYTTIPLTYRQITFATNKSKADCATKYSSSYLGQTFLRTKKPRTNACIFLSRARPNFLTICLGSKGVGFSFLILKFDLLMVKSLWGIFAIEG